MSRPPVESARYVSVRVTDVTIKALDEIDSIYDGFFVRLRAELGVSSFGMQVYRYPPNADFVAPHNHVGHGPDDGQEEVYAVLEGRATLLVGHDSFELAPGVFARVGPGEMRQIVTHSEAATLLVLGATPDQAYTPDRCTELDVSEAELDEYRRTRPTAK